MASVAAIWDCSSTLFYFSVIRYLLTTHMPFSICLWDLFSKYRTNLQFGPVTKRQIWQVKTVLCSLNIENIYSKGPKMNKDKKNSNFLQKWQLVTFLFSGILSCTVCCLILKIAIVTAIAMLLAEYNLPRVHICGT